uniref:Uncharacterized protein n=1 Tax=Oncorhynchus kisutch TaxID=8019 RepID=A0A8C7F2V1_ONCKI
SSPVFVWQTLLSRIVGGTTTYHSHKPRFHQRRLVAGAIGERAHCNDK